MKTLIMALLCLGLGVSAPTHGLEHVGATEDEEQNDPHAEFLVFTDGSGLRYYEFDQETRNHEKASEHCETKGLRLMTIDEALDLEKEIATDELKLEKWLGAKGFIWVWTSSAHTDNSDYAWFFYVDDFGHVEVSSYDIENVHVGRCVGW